MTAGRVLRIAIWSIGVIAVGISVLWLTLFWFTRTQVTLRNESSHALTEVVIDFAGPATRVDVLEPREETTTARRYVGEGNLRVSFKKNGSQHEQTLAYVARNMKLTCLVVVSDADDAVTECDYGP